MKMASEASCGQREPLGSGSAAAEVGQPQPITFRSVTPADLILLMSIRCRYHDHY